MVLHHPLMDHKLIYLFLDCMLMMFYPDNHTSTEIHIHLICHQLQYFLEVSYLIPEQLIHHHIYHTESWITS